MNTEHLYKQIEEAQDEIDKITSDAAKLRADIAKLLHVFCEGLDCDEEGALDHIDDAITDLVSDATTAASRRKNEAEDAISNIEYRGLMRSRPVVI